MFSVLWAIAISVANLFKSRRRLEVENLLLRHQLNIVLRRAPARPHLFGIDRAILGGLVRLWPELSRVVQVVKPDTILRWHRMGFRAYWRWTSRRRAGRPKIDRDLRDLIRRMCLENPLWGASRIHGELLMLGFEVAQPTVSKYMVRGRKPPSQNWATFLRNNAEAVAAIDLWTVPTVIFDRLFAFLVVGHGRRHLLRFAVTRHPTADWLARQITEAFPWASAPTYLVRDNDRSYGTTFITRVGAMGIRDRPISIGSPWQNGIAERLSARFVTSALTTLLYSASDTYIVCCRLMPLITIKHAHTGRFAKTRHCGGRSDGRVTLSLSQSWVDYIMNMCGYDFRKGQWFCRTVDRVNPTRVH
jgi:hypothetical protein